MDIYNNKDKYKFDQTPVSLCKDIIKNIDWYDGEVVLEPFAGDNGFYDNLPGNVIKYRCEITEGSDFRHFDHDSIKIDTVISNPPFDLGENTSKKRKNDFFNIVKFYAEKPEIKRIIFLCSSICFNSLTGKRLEELKRYNMYLTKMVSCKVRKWYGSYFVVHLERYHNASFDYLLGNYE